MTDLTIHKGPTNTGRWIQKVPRGTGCKKAKRTAMLDITKESGHFYTRNYLNREYLILLMKFYSPEILPL